MSKIKVNSIEAATGSTITIPSGQTLDISSTTLTLPSTVVTTTGTQTLTNKTIGVSQLSGTLPVANGGTGLTSLGSASQVLRVNSGATALEFGTVATGANAGEIIQVVSTLKTDVFGLLTGNTYTDITGLSVTITPSSASNKILVMYTVSVGTNAASGYGFLKLLRGATDIFIGDASGNRTRATTSGASPDTNSEFNNSVQFLDSPNTTSATTYKIQAYAQAGTGVIYINSSYGDANASYSTRTASSITVMEVKG